MKKKIKVNVELNCDKKYCAIEGSVCKYLDQTSGDDWKWFCSLFDEVLNENKYENIKRCKKCLKEEVK